MMIPVKLMNTPDRFKEQGTEGKGTFKGKLNFVASEVKV